jgi:uncharacterized protein YbjT (DUF2867 family)
VRWQQLNGVAFGICWGQNGAVGFAFGKETRMFVLTGITGQVGGVIAQNLLAANLPVRAVVRNLRKGDSWANRGCEVVSADITDSAALSAAFEGAEAAFVLVPPNFDPLPVPGGESDR